MKVNPLFRVSAFAALAGVSSKVLRDYDARGLFRPAFVDRTTGYRMYSPAQLPDLRRILALRDLGVSVADIQGLVSHRADLQQVLERRRSALEVERRELTQRLVRMGIELDAASAGAGGLDVVVRELGPEPVAILAVAEVAGQSLERAFYELELRVRDEGVRAPRPPGALVTVDAAGGRRVEAFVPVLRKAGGQTALELRKLPACRAATVIHQGDYAGLRSARTKLDQWIADAGLHAEGSIRILYLRFGAESDLRLPERFLAPSDDDFLTELQIPIAGAGVKSRT